MRLSSCSLRCCSRVAASYNLFVNPNARYYVNTFNLPLFQNRIPASRLKSTYIEQNSQKSIFKSILRKMGWLDVSKSKLKRSSYYLYESVADKLHYITFFKEFDLEDTFFSWFLVTELHVWMLLVRVMAEGEEGRYVRNNIVEAMWTDVSTRSKKLEVINASLLSKHMTMLSEQFQAALVGYDEGILSDDRVLAGALWRRFFKQECSDPEKLECLVKYVREQVKLLDDIPADELLTSPSITWIPLKPKEHQP